ncbi:MAG TPA: metalloregulator ArsR/SmtB family transcription factor [Acidimicrobiales bacterium]|nr:metalloregulator ArsR/SmtB family transcription factor [Acidimicrobiales bacterium]
MTPTATDVLPLLRALGEPNRLRLFMALRDKERCVRDLVDTEGLPQPLVSHHLRVLADAGLVVARRSEGFSLYAVSPDGLTAARQLAMELLDPAAVGPLARPGGNDGCCR